MLCRMRYEERTFHEVEVRLTEPGELRAALGLHDVPGYTLGDWCLPCLEAAVLEPALRVIVQRWIAPLGGQRPGGA